MDERFLNRKIRRRDFLAGAVGLVVGSTVIGLGCGEETTEPAASASPSFSPTIKAQVDGDLDYFGWADFIDPDVVKAFEKEYGVKVNQTYFDSDDAMVQKVASGIPYDWICTNSAYIPRMLEAKLLQPIPKDQLTNWGEVTEFFQDPFYDPGAWHGVPYGYSATGIGWRTDKVDSASMLNSWNDLWEHPEADGKKYVLDQIEEALGMSLIRLGYKPDTTDPAQMDEAANALIELKPKLAGFSTDDYTNLSNGQAWIHQSWACDSYFAAGMVDDPKLIGFEVPKEGGLIGVDCQSIGANAKHPGTALLFIDWMLAPENSAKNVAWMGQLNGTTAGDAAAQEALANFPAMLDLTVLETAYWKLSPTGERLDLMNKAWTKVKAA